MTAQSPHAEFDVDSAVVFAVARSDWLDAFSRLEVAVFKCAARRRLPPLPRGAPLSQRIKQFGSLEVGPKCSRAIAHTLADFAATVEKLLPLCATIVHSALVNGQRQGTPVALFQNVLDAASDTPTYVVMTLEELDQARNQLQRLAEQLESLP